jgi:hypothetical protein
VQVKTKIFNASRIFARFLKVCSDIIYCFHLICQIKWKLKDIKIAPQPEQTFINLAKILLG